MTSKEGYILHSLSKIAKKQWEHYAINRIYHTLSDPEIEFVCQQCIRRNDKEICLADFFLPQLHLYLEIDEGHHDSDEAKIRDAKRFLDIADATGFTERRISASKTTLKRFSAEIDAFVQEVRNVKAKLVAEGRFPEWDYERRFSAASHIEAGFIEVGPRAAFRTHRDALNCFGYRKGDLQKAVWSLPPPVADAIGLNGKCVVWFPHLYEQAHWDNSLSEDGTIITERNKDPNHSYTEPWDARIVMARSRDSLNRTLYRFVGVFKIIPEYRTGNMHKFQRISTIVKTYQED